MCGGVGSAGGGRVLVAGGRAPLPVVDDRVRGVARVRVVVLRVAA